MMQTIAIQWYVKRSHDANYSYTMILNMYMKSTLIPVNNCQNPWFFRTKNIAGEFGELTLFEPLAKEGGKLIDQPIDYLLYVLIWMVLVWWITDDLLNLSNFPPAKLSCYTVGSKPARDIYHFISYVDLLMLILYELTPSDLINSPGLAVFH